MIDLSLFEEKIFSQHGEDGIIRKLFQIIGVVNKNYVEFGTENGMESNTRYLRENHGWSGLLMDCENENLSINLHKEFITAENINDLFKKYNVQKNFDLLSIDIDYNDFYIWKSIKNKYKPRVVVIEYNATHQITEDKIVKYNPFNFWDGTNYFGASIKSLYNLGRKKGYSLIYAENIGVNLFFLRDDVLEKGNYKYKDMNNIELIYKSPKYGNGPNGGHVEDLKKREYVSFKNIRFSQFLFREFLKFNYFFKNLIITTINITRTIILFINELLRFEEISFFKKLLKFTHNYLEKNIELRNISFKLLKILFNFKNPVYLKQVYNRMVS
jgi:hypothetical protein